MGNNSDQQAAVPRRSTRLAINFPSNKEPLQIDRPALPPVKKSQWLPPQISDDSVFTAVGTHVTEEGIICVLDNNSWRARLMLNKLLDDHYNGRFDVAVREYELDEPVVALFTQDDKWHRGRIVEINKTNYDVLFVDYGNIEEIEPSRIRRCKQPSLLDIPIQRLDCRLYGVVPSTFNRQWTTKVLDQVHKLLVEKEFTVTVVRKGTPMDVTIQLCDPKQDVAEWLVANRYARYASKELQEAFEAATDAEVFLDSFVDDQVGAGCGFHSMILPPVGEVLRVDLTYIPEAFTAADCSFQVWVQRIPMDVAGTEYQRSCQREVEEFLSLITEMESHADAMIPLENAFCGEPCLCQYSKDKMWYRATVQQVHGDGRVLVHYVDYGNSEIATNGVHELPDEWIIKAPKQAIQCQLNIRPANGQPWQYKHFSRLSKKLNQTVGDVDRWLYARFLRYSDGVAVIDLMDSSYNLAYAELLRNGEFEVERQ